MNKNLVIAAAGVLLVAAAPAFAGTDFTKALTEGKVNADLRARYENVDTSGLDTADAFLGRARLGYTTGDFYGVTGVVEGEAVQHVFDQDYDDATGAATGDSVVADPDTVEVNQAYLQYGLYDTTIRGGRQVLADWDNGRWVGSDNWRMNQTSYDGVLVQSKFFPHVTASYAYVAQQNNNLGLEAPAGNVDFDSNLVNISTDWLKFLTVSGYGYFLDSDDTAAGATAFGSNTWGIRGSGNYAIDNAWKVLYAGEYANQEDAGHNAASYDLNYWTVEGGVGYKSFTARVGYEVAEGETGAGIVNPFGDNHQFNGKADVIGLSNGGAGLEDLYVAGDITLGQVHQYVDGTKIAAEWHDFNAENGSADLGQEFDIEVTKDFGKHYTAGVLFASYDADSFAADTDKIVVSVGAKF